VEKEEVQSILELFPEQSRYLVEQIEKNKQNLLAALEVATQIERSLETLYRDIDEFDVLGGKFYGLSEHFQNVFRFWYLIYANTVHYGRLKNLFPLFRLVTDYFTGHFISKLMVHHFSQEILLKR
jgi:hypothetical protein